MTIGDLKGVLEHFANALEIYVNGKEIENFNLKKVGDKIILDMEVQK